jgi:hypothetical protein
VFFTTKKTAGWTVLYAQQQWYGNETSHVSAKVPISSFQLLPNKP